MTDFRSALLLRNSHRVNVAYRDKRQDGLEEWDDIISMHLAARCSVSLRPLLSYHSNHRRRHDLKWFWRKYFITTTMTLCVKQENEELMPNIQNTNDEVLVRIKTFANADQES